MRERYTRYYSKGMSVRIQERKKGFRSTPYLRVLAEGEVRRGLLQKHVQGCPSAPAVLQSHQQRRLVHDATSGHVDDADASLALAQDLGSDEVARVRQERRVHRDVVRPRPQLLQRHGLHAPLGGHVGGDHGVVADGGHAEGLHALGNLW